MKIEKAKGMLLKIALLVALAATLVAALYPPWSVQKSTSLGKRQTVAWGFILSPPNYQYTERVVANEELEKRIEEEHSASLDERIRDEKLSREYNREYKAKQDANRTLKLFTVPYAKYSLSISTLLAELLAIWAAYGIVVVATQLLAPKPPHNQ